MTTISNVDASSKGWLQNETSKPTQDFAHELAKRESQEKMADHAQSAASENDSRPNQSDGQEQSLASHMGSGPTTDGSSQTTWAAEQITILQEERLANTVVAPTVLTEALLGARVYGWHLQAQAYLSELSLADKGADSETTIAEAKTLAVHASTEEFESASPPSGMVEMASSKAQSGTTSTESVAEEATLVSTDDATPSSATELATSDASLAGYWAERSLRFTRQPDGSNVAWLRDFRISDAEAPRLVALALSDANAKGLNLSKIMLNGREAWSSPTGL